MAKLREAIEEGLAPTEHMDRALDVFDWLLGDRPRAKGYFIPGKFGMKIVDASVNFISVLRRYSREKAIYMHLIYII